MVAFEHPTGIATHARRWTKGPIGWAANDSSKPGRPRTYESWVVHAAPQWSREHLEADAQEAARLLLHELANALGAPLPKAVHLQAHRWRHSFVEKPLGLPCLVDEEIAAGACGDWCVAPRVEAAFESGRTLAHSLASMLGLAANSLLR